MNPVFSTSQRGNPVIMIGQYRYNRRNTQGSRTRWVCVKYKFGCKASLYTINGAVVRLLGEHDPGAHARRDRARVVFYVYPWEPSFTRGALPLPPTARVAAYGARARALRTGGAVAVRALDRDWRLPRLRHHLQPGILSRLLGHTSTTPLWLSQTQAAPPPPSCPAINQNLIGSLFNTKTQNKENMIRAPQDFSTLVPPGIYLPPGLSVIPGPFSSPPLPVKQEKIMFNQELMQCATSSSAQVPASPGIQFFSGLSVFPDSSGSQPHPAQEENSSFEQELFVEAGGQRPPVAGDGHSLLVELSGPKFTTSQRGHVVINWGNYRYNRHSKYKKSKVLWRCCRWTAGCRASLYSYNDKIIDKKNDHNHV
ncbi:hypothetical protein O0L34_g17119 [Tuta absoluta]|nr:hypothetical protein O0L34_g17119 [Tuta absoluta]